MSPHELSRLNEHILQYDVAGFSYLAWAVVFLYILFAPKSGMRAFLVVSILAFLMVSYSGFASAHALRFGHDANVITAQRWGTLAKALSGVWVVIEAPKLRYIFQIWAKVLCETRERLADPDIDRVNVFVRLRRMTHFFHEGS